MSVFVGKHSDFSASLFEEEQATYFDTEHDYLNDPDLIHDPLPQPFRMINKVLNLIYDIAWKEISERESDRIEESLRVRPPHFECEQLQECGNALCLQSSLDGNYLFVGQPSGISVIDVATRAVKAHWTILAEVISQLQVVQISSSAYLLSAIDDSGNARLLAFQDKFLVELCHLNEETGSADDAKKTVVHKCEISSDAAYVAVTQERNFNEGSSVEIYKTPLDLWLKELDSYAARAEELANKAAAGSEGADESSVVGSDGNDGTAAGAGGNVRASNVTVKFSTCTTLLRIMPPKPLTGVSWVSAYQLGKTVDSSGEVVGQGNNHLLSTLNLDQRWEAFSSQHSQCAHLSDSDKAASAQRQPTVHFLKPNRFLSDGNVDATTNIVVWWTNHSQIAFYSLTKTVKDVERSPDVVWPMASRPVCSAVTPCTQLLCVAFDNANVVVWNLKQGLVQRTINVDVGAGSHMTEVMFVDTSDMVSSQRQVVLGSQSVNAVVVALTNAGDTYRIPLQATEPVCHISKGSGKASESLISILPVADYSKLMLGVSLNGRVCVHDVTSSETSVSSELLEVALPITHQLATPWHPIYTVASHTVFVKGEPKLAANGDAEQPQPALFSLSVQSASLPDTYLYRTFAERLAKNKQITAEDRINTLLATRIEQQAMRQSRRSVRWSELQQELEGVKKLNSVGAHPHPITATLQKAS